MNSRDEYPYFEDEGSGYLISVSDMMAGLMFIFIITLMVFVLNYEWKTRITEEERDHLVNQQKQTIHEKNRLTKVVTSLTNTRELRKKMLLRIHEELEKQDIRVEVDTEHGILHLTEKAINFPSSRAVLPARERNKLDTIGKVLSQILPCYAYQGDAGTFADCEKEKTGKLESVFIEGHTDNVPYIDGPFQDNLNLSAQRAMYTYKTMVLEMYPVLSGLRNTEGFPIFSVSGYGDGRPRNPYDEPTADPANRRIDLRFIMTPPNPEALPVKELKKEGL